MPGLWQAPYGTPCRAGSRPAGEHPEALRRNTVKESAGDLLIDITPGFEIVDFLYKLMVEEETAVMVGRHKVAVAIYGHQVYIEQRCRLAGGELAVGNGPPVIGQPVDVRAIAPTVARILRIRSPNGASVAPLSLEKR